MNRLAAILFASAIAFALTGAAAPANALPPQGVYEACPLSQPKAHCGARLRVVGSAGFRVVLNAWALRTPAYVPGYAAAAKAAGVKLIWPIRDMRLVPLLRELPTTWGYYLADEPKASDHDALAAFASAVHVADPTHPRLVVGCGVCHEDLRWLGDVDALIGVDSYPTRTGPSNPKAVAEDTRATIGDARVAVLQAWRWGDSATDSRNARLDPVQTRFPTLAEMRAQRDAVPGASLILWFWLPDVIGWGPGLRGKGWSNPPDPLQRWDRLVRAAFDRGRPARGR